MTSVNKEKRMEKKYLVIKCSVVDLQYKINLYSEEYEVTHIAPVPGSCIEEFVVIMSRKK